MSPKRAAERAALEDEQADLKLQQTRIRETYAAASRAVEAASTAADEAITVRERARLEYEQAEAVAKAATDAYGDAKEACQQLEDRDAEIGARLKQIAAELAKPVTQALPGHDELFAAAQRFGEFSIPDIAAVAKVTKAQATTWVKQQVADKHARPTGRKVMGHAVYELLTVVQERKEAASEALHVVRDYVVKQTGEFSSLQVSKATDVEGDELTGALSQLIQMGTIQYVGFEGMDLYEYIKPVAMGAEAERDAKTRKARSKAEAASNGHGSPVAGTGRGQTFTDPDVRALATAIVHAGGSVEQASGGGHFAVTAPGSKRRVLISSTPSSRRSVANDRARVRRELGLKI